MGHYLVDSGQHLAETIVRWKQSGVTHVLVVPRRDECVCENCRRAAMDIIPITDMDKHREQCLSGTGCRCQFRPLVPITSNCTPFEF